MGILIYICIYSLLGYGSPGRTDDPDPVTGLTSRDIFLVKSSYENVKKNPTQSGIALFNLLLKNHPEYVEFFSFRDIPIKDLPENKRYQAHVTAVIYSFSSIVDSLDETDLLIPILMKVGESHAVRGVTVQAFLDAKKTLIELFSSDFTETEMAAWNKTLDVAFEVMTRAMKDKQIK